MIIRLVFKQISRQCGLVKLRQKLTVTLPFKMGHKNYLWKAQEIYKEAVDKEFTMLCNMRSHKSHFSVFCFYRGNVGFYLRDTMNSVTNCNFCICISCQEAQSHHWSRSRGVQDLGAYILGAWSLCHLDVLPHLFIYQCLF